MNKVIFITGPQGSGKTILARKLSEGKNAVWLDSFFIRNDFGLSRVNEETELMVADEVSIEDLREIIYLASCEEISINAMNKWPKTITRPEMIIVCPCSLQVGLHIIPFRPWITHISLNLPLDGRLMINGTFTIHLDSLLRKSTDKREQKS